MNNNHQQQQQLLLQRWQTKEKVWRAWEIATATTSLGGFRGRTALDHHHRDDDGTGSDGEEEQASWRVALRA